MQQFGMMTILMFKRYLFVGNKWGTYKSNKDIF